MSVAYECHSRKKKINKDKNKNMSVAYECRSQKKKNRIGGLSVP